MRPEAPHSDGLDGDSAPAAAAVLDAPGGEVEAEEEAEIQGDLIAAPREARHTRRKHKPAMDWLESTMSRIGASSNFFHRLFSLIWLPYAFRSGIKMKRIDKATFTAVLPFRRFNRNWYNAMAGAALLANSEIAAGMYLFGLTGGGYSIVCKSLTYRFLRPCFGPALYRVRASQDVEALVAAGKEFNVELELDVVQQIHAKRGKERRVGKCVTTFYATPKSLRQTNKAGEKSSR